MAEKYGYEESEKLAKLIKWQPYSKGAFERARKHNKPIYLVISAAWCHWCHVYESKKFLYNQRIRKYINENFIPIFVDSDRRPEITRQYLEGGWPSTTVLTPYSQRIFGFSGPVHLESLERNMHAAVEVVKNNRYLRTLPKIAYPDKEPSPLTKERLQKMGEDYISAIFLAYDEVYGGFGRAQKFPQPKSLDYLLGLYENEHRDIYLNSVNKALWHEYTKDRAAKEEEEYHLLDPVEGGFHRYSTKRDFTDPHYEKLLADNARMLYAYAHLHMITKSALSREVVEKTATYLLNVLQEGKLGVFYGSQDADESYYLHTKKERAKLKRPFIDKAIYLDANCEAAIAFMRLSTAFKDKKYLKIALRTLDFLIGSMYFEDGARHYLGPKEKTPQIQGQLTDNAHLLLTCVLAYQETQSTKYLLNAVKIANYCIMHLYDDQKGGFFERNSEDKESYADYEAFLPNKPYSDNGMMAYALLLLYKESGKRKKRYLEAAKKTMELLCGYSGYLDDAYYFAKAAEFMLNEKVV